MMRDLAISYGNSRQTKKWVNKTISFDALKERLKTTIRTTESAEEYAKMSKAQRDAAKDHGGFVGGTLKGGRRKIDTVELRSMIALDGDRIDKAFLDSYETNAPYTSVLYTTHSSTEDSPRVRIIFPMGVLVEAEDNPQMKLYALGALAVYDALYDIREVSMTIFQPRRENVSTWTIPVEDLKSWAENELKPRAKMAYDGEGEYLPGEWCTFCRAAVRCRARAEEKLKLAQTEFRMPPLLTDAEIEDILAVLPDLTKWANEITAYALDAALNHGKEWNGFKVVEGRSVRKYRDEAAVAEAAKEAGYKDIYRQSLIPLTEMQRLMGKDKFEEILGGLITKAPGRPTLVPKSDRRPAMNISNAINEFYEIKEDI